MEEQGHEKSLFNPQRWGLPAEATTNLSEQLQNTWEPFQACFKTRTRDPPASMLIPTCEVC